MRRCRRIGCDTRTVRTPLTRVRHCTRCRPIPPTHRSHEEMSLPSHTWRQDSPFAYIGFALMAKFCPPSAWQVPFAAGPGFDDPGCWPVRAAWPVLRRNPNPLAETIISVKHFTCAGRVLFLRDISRDMTTSSAERALLLALDRMG